MDHAEFSPSSFPARGKCAHWIQQPEKEESEDSPKRRGILGHLALAAILKDNTNKNVPAECTPDEIAAAEWAAKYIKKNTSSSRLIEQKIEIELDFDLWTFGTADVIDPPLREKLVVVDYKAGAYSKGYLLQVMAYALGAMQKYDCEKVRLFVLYGVDRYPLITDTNYEECEAAVRKIKHRCEHPEEYKYVPCEFCEWCGNHISCEALNNKVQKVATEYEDNFELDNYHSSEITNPKMMAKALELAKICENWAQSVKHHAKEMALNGTNIPGYEITTRANRIYREEDVPDVFRVSGFTSEEFISCCKVSPSKIEKKMAEKAGFKSVTSKIKNAYNSKLGTLTQNEEKIILQKSRQKKEKK